MLRVELVNTASMGENHFVAQARVTVASKEWKKYTVVLTPSQTLPKGTLRIFLETRGVSVDVEHVSLFPVDTWKGREGGPVFSASPAAALWKALTLTRAMTGRTP